MINDNEVLTWTASRGLIQGVPSAEGPPKSGEDGSRAKVDVSRGVGFSTPTLNIATLRDPLEKW